MKNKIYIFKNIVLVITIILFFYLIFIGRNQYIFNMSYKKCVIYMILVSLFIYNFGLVDNTKNTYNKNIIIYIILYFILLVSVTFYIGRTDIKLYDYWYQGQYKLFHTIKMQLNYGSFNSVAKNIFGNVIMLIPLSFLLMIKNKKYNNILKQFIIIFPIIILIEVFQAFTHVGAFDVDDIFLNYFGTVIFTCIITRFQIIDKIRTIFYKDFKIKKSIKYGLFYFITFLLIIYIYYLLFF